MALPLSTNVQVLALLPLLEHAPDQMASRLLVICSLIDVPVVNDAEPVEPTLTLIPVGVEVTRSPLRPDAVTVKVAIGPVAAPCGVKLRTAENGPNTPAELRARTRHHSCCAGRPDASEACDDVTVGLATNGEAIVDESSTCTS